MALFIKLIAALFFAFLSFDAFRKSGKIRKEVKDDLLSPYMGEALRKQALRRGLMFLILTLALLGLLFVRIAPLGE